MEQLEISKRGGRRVTVAAIGTGAACLAFGIASSPVVASKDAAGPLIVSDATATSIATAPGAPIERPPGLAPGASDTQVARAFVNDRPKRFGLDAAGAGLDLVRVTREVPGLETVRFEVTIDGVPVVGGDVVVNLDPDQDIVSATGESLPGPAPDSDPAITADEAAAVALASVAKGSELDRTDLTASEPYLSYYDPRILGGPGPHVARLVWRFEITAGAVDPVRRLVLVDAEDGGVSLSFNQVHEVLNRIVCDGANVRGADFPCTSAIAERVEGGPSAVVAEVNAAYDFAGQAHGLFLSRFGRDSVDGAGLQIKTTVRYCEEDLTEACPYANAFWNGHQMAFGAGYTVDDIVAHEFTHGVTDFSSDLFYWYQSGAINESISDVFGEFVDQLNGSGIDTAASKWRIGEDRNGGAGSRDMENPPTFNDPDQTDSPLYVADINQIDNGGVHTNSGVNNKAAFLMTDGGTFNGQTITALGITKVARIYYAAETTQLRSASDYQDLAVALRAACTSSIGVDGITEANCTEVGDAVLATEMINQPANAAAPEAPTCDGTDSPENLFFDDLENTASGNWLSGDTVPGPPSINAWQYPQVNGSYATSGTRNFRGVAGAAASDSAIAMTRSFPVPSGRPAFFRFRHSYAFEDGDDDGVRFDGGVIEYSADGGATWVDAGSLIDSGAGTGYNGTLAGTNALGARSAFTAESFGYISSRLDLSSLAGQSVRFRFRLGTDPTLSDRGWFIDDVRLYICGPDGDADGRLDASDNCPTMPNAEQADADADSLGDVCDQDDDNDGVLDEADACPTTAGTGPDGCVDLDADDDGVPDTADVCPNVAGGLSPNGCPDIVRGLSLVCLARLDLFRGRLRPAGACASDQKVKVFRKRPGRDGVVGIATTKAKGSYRLKRNLSGGTFYAKAGGRIVPEGGNCGKARSSNVRVG